MKKFGKLFFAILMILLVVPVCAKELVSIENIVGKTDDNEVILNATGSIDVHFNDLNQKATYKVKIKNNTDDFLYVNDLITEDLSEDFIEFALTEKSYNAKLEPGKTKEVEVTAKTLDITHAGRNVNDEITLKFLLGEKIKNPETSSNWIVYLILCVTLFITFSSMFSKFENKKKLSIFVVGMLLCGTMVVSANDSDYVELKGKVKYTSQNLMQESGTKLDGYKASYVNSTDVWKHAEEVKNIIILDDKNKFDDYVGKFDLTINSSKRIYGYLVENRDSKNLYDLYIVANGVIYAPANSTGLFSFPNVETIKGLEYIEFDNTTNMTGMFLGNKKLKSANVKDINTSNALNTTYMFNGCDKLNVAEKDFDLSKVTNKSYMFNERLSDVVKLNAKSDKDVNFAVTPVTGKYMIESTKDDKNPIYYYRGAVTNNNVLFADKCWMIVRTTETGGTKLIYNGVPKNGSCDNTGTESQIETISSFNSSSTSPAYLGYMYGNVYKYSEKDLSNQSGKYTYGNSFEWNGSKYILKDTKTSSSWNEDRKMLAVKYHYTCFNSTGTCTEISYIHHFGYDNKAYYFTLNNGEDINDALDKMFTNITSSSMKTVIDNWYKSNMLNYTQELEDTIWCNEREFTTGALSGSNTDAGTSSSYFAVYDRNFNKVSPKVTCSTKRDSFTVDSSNGNGKLTYPIGLLTADEVTLAGNGNKYYSTTSYLYSGENYYTMSPCGFNNTSAYAINLYPAGNIYSHKTSYNGGIRPSISLKAGIDYVSGTGTKTDPYIVE